MSDNEPKTCQYPTSFAAVCGKPAPCPDHGETFTGSYHLVINEIEAQPYKHPLAKMASFLLAFAEKEDPK